MRRIKKMVTLMMAIMVLLLMSGCAEEPTGAQIPITPTNQDTPLDVLIGDTDTFDGEAGNDAGDKVTISFDWSISKNGNMDLQYGYFRAEWVGWKDGKDGQYIGAIHNPIDTFSADHMQGHAQFMV